MKNKASKKYIIKVPVFTSERHEIEGGMFPITYEEIVNDAKKLINKHNENNFVVTSDKRNKTIIRVIDKVIFHEYNFGEIPYLLLQISAYNTNWEGCLITSENTLQIENNDKIGSDNNFILLYPQIIGIENQSIFWIILVYDDPKKESLDNIGTAKLVLTKILNKPVKNVKLHTVLKELKDGQILPQIKMNLNSIKFDENNVSAKLEKYCTSSKFIRKEEYEFNNMPFQEIEDLIKSPFIEYTQRIIKLIVRKKEYKLTQQLKEDAQNSFNELVEEIFNMSTPVQEEELKDIYQIDFVRSKLQEILELYLKNGND